MSDHSTATAAAIVRMVHERLGATIDPAVIEREVAAELALYTDARLTQFVPILVESRVRTRLVRSHSS
jgi:hypothetical protein